MNLTSGTKLGPYEIVSLIGAGGMGEVYRARDSRLRRDVAIKVLPQALSLDGGTPVYSVHPDPVNVVPLSQFGSVDICQDSCAAPIIPPPLAGLQSAGMLQLSAIDPKQTGTVWVGDSCNSLMRKPGRSAWRARRSTS